jgi:hypothetical protein
MWREQFERGHAAAGDSTADNDDSGYGYGDGDAGWGGVFDYECE